MSQTIDTALEFRVRMTLSPQPHVLGVSGCVQTLLGISESDLINGTVCLRSRIHTDNSDVAEALFSPQLTPPAGTTNLRIRKADGRNRRVIFWNKASERLYGYSREQALGRPLEELIIPAPMRSTVVSLINEWVAGGSPIHSSELTLEDARGHPVEVFSSHVLLRGSDGEPEMYCIDIGLAEQKRLQRALVTSEGQFRSLAENSPDIFTRFDRDCRSTYISPELARITGKQVEQILGKSPTEFWPLPTGPEQASYHEEQIRWVLQNGQRHEWELDWQNANGEPIAFQFRAVPEVDAEGNIASVLTVARDISYRKLVEASLRAERDANRTLLDTVEAIIVALDRGGRITLINRKGCELFGYRLEELVGRDWFETCLPASFDKSLVREVYRKALAADLQGSEYFENPILTRDGRERLIAWHNSVLRDADGQVIGGMSAGEDITDRRRAEDALRRNEALLRTVIDEMPDVFVLKDHKGDFLLCNQTVARLYNTTPEAMVGKHDGDFGVPKEMADFFRENVLAIMARGETEIVYEDSRDAASGEIRHFKSIKKPFKTSEGENRILIIAQDITDVINAQARIAASERRLQEVLEITREGLWDWHLPSGTVQHNPQWYRTLGSEAGVIPDTLEAFEKLIHPDDKADVFARIDALLHGKADTYQSEHRLLQSDGQVIWVQDRGQVVERDASGAPLRVLGSFTDVSARKLAERALRDSEERYRSYIENAPEGIFVADAAGRYLDVNPAACRLVGYSRSELLKMSIHDLVPTADDLPEHLQPLEHTLSNGGIRRELNLRHKNGSIVLVELSTVLLSDNQVMGFCWDITELRLTTHALLDSEARYRRLADDSTDWIWELGLDGQHLYCNNRVEQLLGVKAEVFLSTDMRQFVHPDDLDLLAKTFETAIVNQSGWQGVRIRWRTTKGDYRSLESNASPMFDSQLKLLGFQGVDRDITEQIAYQHQLEHVAHFDALTGLPNRVLLADRIHQAMLQATRRKLMLQVAYIDLDGFKAVNDTYGHEVGDQLLVGVAEQMKNALRADDTIARLGGDEFVAVLLDVVDPNDSEPLIQRIRQVLEWSSPLNVYCSDRVTVFSWPGRA